MEIIVDLFAGGGGASEGIREALGRGPDIAVNHDAEAVMMHAANHPETRHLCGNVWDVRPREVCRGRRVGLLWLSPDCKHFSKAKGGKPVEKGIRSLAWVAVRWARDVKPRVIILENVEEFAGWGPIDAATNMPDRARKGETFRRWCAQLRAAGYVVEWRELRACDYGAPTIRKRLFVIARRDGAPIVWPARTHGPGTGKPYRTAADCIDWSIPCPSIFDRKRPLADNTLRRIARGIWRFVINAREPFIVPVSHAGDDRVHSVREPLRTVTGAHRGEHALVVPTLIQTGYGERPGQVPRVPGLDKPLGTVVAGGAKHAVVAAFLAKHYGGHEATGSRIPEPVSTVTTQDHHSLVAAHMLKLRGSCADGQPVDRPAPTVTAGGTHLAEVRAFLMKYHGGERGDSRGQLPLEPFRTLDTANRFGLVTVAGEDYAIVDIGMRMLVPRELYRAQGFRDAYQIEPLVGGKPLSKTAQVRMCGNSVPPALSCALVAANVRGEAVAA